NLSQQGGAGSTVLWNGNQVTVDFNADGGTPVSTFAGLNWASYRYGNAGWQTMNSADAWNEMDRRLNGLRDPGDSQLVADGKAVVTELYYTLMVNGLTNIVQIGDVTTAPEVQYVDDSTQNALISSTIN